MRQFSMLLLVLIFVMDVHATVAVAPGPMVRSDSMASSSSSSSSGSSDGGLDPSDRRVMFTPWSQLGAMGLRLAGEIYKSPPNVEDIRRLKEAINKKYTDAQNLVGPPSHNFPTVVDSSGERRPDLAPSNTLGAVKAIFNRANEFYQQALGAPYEFNTQEGTFESYFSAQGAAPPLTVANELAVSAPGSDRVTYTILIAGVVFSILVARAVCFRADKEGYKPLVENGEDNEV